MPFARKFFTAKEQQLLMDAIAKAELNTSGEIRLHMENFCFGDALKRAEKVFAELKMYETAERNGVLIYIATMSRKIAVAGDSGIHSKLGSEFWKRVTDDLIRKFKADKKAAGLADCIIECGNQLGKYFPRKDDDRNELSNSISF